MARKKPAKNSPDERLRIALELRDMKERVGRGEDVPCPECGARLVWYGLDAGIHPALGRSPMPGIYCENGHEIMIVTYKLDLPPQTRH